jgi:HlyD family secretion protein
MGFYLPAALAVLAALLLEGCTAAKEKSPSVSGTIEIDEAHVASRYGGRVAAIHAQEGDSLKTGQLIVELEAAELGAQRAHAAAVLAEMEAGPRPEEIAAAKSDWQSRQAELDYAVAENRRSNELFENKTISQTERDWAQSRAAILIKSVAAAKSRHDLLLAGTRPEQIAQARAALAQIDAQLREMRIVAPTNSTLEVLSVKTGDVLAPNREVATLLFSNHLWLRVFVPENWLGKIKMGAAVKVRADSFPEKEFDGVVEQIARAAEFTPRNVQTAEERIKQVFGIKIRLNNQSDALRAGMSAEVVFPDVQR